ncbi:MAG: hypothetical protein FJ299_10545 [Planctomycetes bacterium]|nr:hypothetical protein [Planctomycetota bacterium]
MAVAALLLCLCQASDWPLDAWGAAAALPAGLQRERELTEIAYQARDFEASAAHAAAGLQAAPQDLRLLQLACGSALWNTDTSSAGSLLSRWRAALAAATGLDESTRAWWQARVDECSARLDQLAELEQAGARCANRARACVAGWALALLLGLAWCRLREY